MIFLFRHLATRLALFTLLVSLNGVWYLLQ